MKRITLLLIIPIAFILLSSGPALAQTKGGDKEELVKAQKIAFFTEKLSLTAEECHEILL